MHVYAFITASRIIQLGYNVTFSFINVFTHLFLVSACIPVSVSAPEDPVLLPASILNAIIL